MQITAYVPEFTNLKESYRYIAQVKRKYGLDVGPNYNLTKNEHPKMPQLPVEKEKAMIEALKHFQMI